MHGQGEALEDDPLARMFFVDWLGDLTVAKFVQTFPILLGRNPT